MTFNFRTELIRAWKHTISRHGVKATFTPKTGDPITGIFIFLNKATQLQPTGDMQTWALGNTIEYSLADIPREVRVGETFIITDSTHPDDGKTFMVKTLETNDGFVVKVVV